MLEIWNQQVETVTAAFRAELAEATAAADLETLRVAYLGKKGRITELFKQMGSVPPEAKREAGQQVNALKAEAEGAFQSRRDALAAADTARRLEADRVDVTLPGRGTPRGRLHPLRQVEAKVVGIFRAMGFDVATGPLVENDFCNFEALNMPRWHPARDMQDSFYFSPDVLLRTHTSPVQVRTMLNHEPPIRILAPGRVFRVDEVDASHSPVFQQIEGLVVAEGITFTDFKGTIAHFCEQMFGVGTKVVFRPSYFPFTEPSAEVDVSCPVCKAAGCSVCKKTGYMEIMGAGMVNPKVLAACGYDPDKYTGFAFGMGTERVAMVLYGVPDIRYFYENDVRFLEKF